MCMGLWSEHGTSWFNCNRFEEKSALDVELVSNVSSPFHARPKLSDPWSVLQALKLAHEQMV